MASRLMKIPSILRSHPVSAVPMDPILGLKALFQKDPSPTKIDLTVGSYVDDQGNPTILHSVGQAVQRYEPTSHDFQYLPMLGHLGYRKEVQKLVFPEEVPEEELVTVQTIAGTSALKLAADLCDRLEKEVIIPTPTWANHLQIFRRVTRVPYLTPTMEVDMKSLMEALSSRKEGVVVLQSGAHNPTGISPTGAEWEIIADLCRRHHHLVVLDNAYQGYHLETSVLQAQESLQMMLKHRVPLMVSFSFSKILGLYGYRVGALTLCLQKEEIEALTPHLTQLVRANYSNPPSFGASLVLDILTDPKLKEEFVKENQEMKCRLECLRTKLILQLEKEIPERSWEHLTRQTGFFAYLNLSPEVMDTLREEHHIYALKNSRINLASLNEETLPQLVGALKEILKDKKK